MSALRAATQQQRRAQTAIKFPVRAHQYQMFALSIGILQSLLSRNAYRRQTHAGNERVPLPNMRATAHVPTRTDCPSESVSLWPRDAVFLRGVLVSHVDARRYDLSHRRSTQGHAILLLSILFRGHRAAVDEQFVDDDERNAGLQTSLVSFQQGRPRKNGAVEV